MNTLARTCVVIPMKNPADSKQRLRPALNSQQRSELAVQMFINTLEFFRRKFPSLCVVVVTPSAHIASLTLGHQHQVLLESRPRGLNKAVEHATEWSLQRGFRRQLIIPADIAELSQQEIRHILNALPVGDGVIIAAAKDGGTNALLCSPPDAIPFCFGTASARAHQLQAEAQGYACEVLELPKLGTDIDQPEDLLPLLTDFYQQAGTAEVVNYG